MRYWLAVLAATLTACGGSSSSPPTQPVVEDTTPPVITLTGDNPQLIEAGAAYTELGATVTDNVDGDLTASIVIDASTVDTTVPGDYAVTYNVSDASGNAATTVTRTVTVQDTTPPVITLLGDDPQVLVTGDRYTELGATASDSLDGDLTAAIVIDASAVDTGTAGDYAVTYDVRDAAANAAATVTRTVRVQNPPLPAAPTVSIEGDIKQLIFSWDAVAGVEYYRLLENADGHSGFTPVGDDIPADTLTATRDIAVHLFDWVEAQYLVESCNIGGCNSSDVITVSDVMLGTIGYFKASNTGELDGFGQGRNSVAVSDDGRTMVVGGAGAAYAFARDGGEWTQQAYIKDSGVDDTDGFGFQLALSGDGRTLAIGAYNDDSAATGINGDQYDSSAPSSGAVYVFRFDGTGWSQQAYIKASNAERGDRFGGSLALSDDGNTLAVGVPSEDSSATGINGDESDNSALASGAVYLFRYDNGDWFQEAYIKASNTAGGEYTGGHEDIFDTGDEFGSAVTLSGDGNTLVVGAPEEDNLATGINGDQFNRDDIRSNFGAAYLFSFDGSAWAQQFYIKASATNDVTPFDIVRFGLEVELSADGKVLAVASFGAIFVLRSDGDTWEQEAYLKPPNAEYRDLFGRSIALNAAGNVLAANSCGEDSAARGVNGDENDDSAAASGAVYVFGYENMRWSQHAYVKSSNSEAGDSFGASMSLSRDGSTMAVSAPNEDGGSTGIGGDQEDNSAEQSGAVYLY